MVLKIGLAALFLGCLLQTVTAPQHQNPQQPPGSSSDKPPNTPQPNASPSGGAQGISAVQEVGDFVAKLSKVVNGQSIVDNLSAMKFEPIPAELKGINNLQIQYYANLLVRERRKLQRHFIYHMTQVLAVGLGSAFMSEPYVFPFMKLIETKDEGHREQLEQQWGQHQERMADFVLEYTKVKKIKVESLRKNSMGVTYIKVNLGPNLFESLPVYRTTKGAPLPQFTKGISNSTEKIMMNWWTDEV